MESCSITSIDTKVIDTPRHGQLDYNPLHMHYHNFTHCKEEISKRLFGKGATQNIEKYKPRNNRWAEELPKPI